MSTNARTFIHRINAFSTNVYQEAMDKEQEIGEELLTEVKRNTPVETGRARDSLELSEEGITTSVPYFNRLDQGYSDQAPGGIVNPALATIVSRYS